MHKNNITLYLWHRLWFVIFIYILSFDPHKTSSIIFICWMMMLNKAQSTLCWKLMLQQEMDSKVTNSCTSRCACHLETTQSLRERVKRPMHPLFCKESLLCFPPQDTNFMIMQPQRINIRKKLSFISSDT